jgi:hypothetical protein
VHGFIASNILQEKNKAPFAGGFFFGEVGLIE